MTVAPLVQQCDNKLATAAMIIQANAQLRPAYSMPAALLQSE